MKPQALTTIGLRILAVYLVSQSFVYIASTATRMLDSQVDLSHSPSLVWAFLWVFAPLIVGLGLWMAAPQLAGWATRRISQEPLPCVDPRILTTTAFMIAGVLICVSALPYVVMEAMRIWNAHQSPETSYAGNFVYLTTHLVQILLGAWLALGSTGLTRFLFSLRYSGSSGLSS
jgi:hypothetical protein